MLTGRIGKAEDMPGWWWADCDDVGAYTQGRSRDEALLMLADCIQTLSEVPLKVTVAITGPTDGNEIDVILECDKPDVLAALIRRQRRGGQAGISP